MSIPRGQKLEAAQAKQLEEIASVLQRLKDEILEYKCPHSGAPLVERLGEWVGSEHYGLREIFQCGYDNLDSMIRHPCPSDPKFPRFADYELKFHQIHSDGKNSWCCLAKPKTEMARYLFLAGYGDTKEEAEQKVRAEYDQDTKKWKP